VLLAGTLVSLSPYTLAAMDEAVSGLNELVAQNRYEEAYVMSRGMLDQYEGDAEFDFLYGLAALESNRISEAVFAFERILLPDRKSVV
jgi:hypothetical protein